MNILYGMRKVLNVIFVIAFCTALIGCTGKGKMKSPTSKAPALTKMWEVSGLNKPESVVHDLQRDVLYVSNINGKGAEKNQKGFISKVSPNGKMIQLEWIKNLNAPKGLSIYGNSLYVTDIDELIEISIDKGIIVKRYKAIGAQFLNDVETDINGDVYVSDTRAGTIYRLKNGELEAWVTDENINSPNGLYADKDYLIVIAAAKNKDRKSRHVQKISYKDKKVSNLSSGAPIGFLDGVQPNGQNGYFLTDWGTGEILNVSHVKEAQPIIQPGKGVADMKLINYKGKNILIVPIMVSNMIIAYEVK